MNRPASLTARLVVVAVALVATVSILIAVIATLAIRSSLVDRLDQDVTSSVRRSGDAAPDGPSGPPLDPSNRGPGTVIARLADPERGIEAEGCVLTTARAGCTTLSQAALDVLAEVPADDDVHGVDLPGAGSYRVTALRLDRGVIVVTGLPTDDVDQTVTSLIGYEALLILLGCVLAAGAGRFVVRRQLRPLREVAATAHTVAALPLASGEIDLAERVPDHLTDEHTEVGQVGSALNSLLAHVESSLDARHRSEQQVRQFVADASHELRTPLSTIAGYAELARTRPDARTVATALAKVEEESGRMTSLVEDLLLLARLDSGRPLERAPVDLTRLLVEAVSDARVVAPGHRWRLELPRGDDGDPGGQEQVPESVVTGDERRLHQVVSNLLTNARRHTPDGTTVTVVVRPDGFDVHDDGPGFAPHLVATAFERFARGDASRNREGGAGLGLSLVEAIVASHGGTVTLTSEPGDTRVGVRLPDGRQP